MDPYANLQEAFADRKTNFLQTVTSLDPSKGSAQARHYFKKDGPAKRTYSRSEQRAALQSLGNDQSVWTDNEALRSIKGPIIDGEDIHLCIARLYAPGAASFPPFPSADQLPDLNQPADFPTLLNLAGLLKLATGQTSSLDRLGIEYRIWDAIAAPKNTAKNQLFSDSLISGIIDALENGPDTSPSLDSLPVEWLAEFSAGGHTLGPSGANDFAGYARRLLGPVLTDTFIETALGDGRTRPSTTPTGLIGNENDSLTLPDDVWAVFQLIRTLGAMAVEPLGQALLDLAKWISLPTSPGPVDTSVHPIEPPTLKLQDIQLAPPDFKSNIIEQLWSNRVSVPFDFIWPDYTPDGVYWWRAVIESVCIRHLFALADTSDFHSVALVRFAAMTQIFNSDPTKRDPRVPAWVIANLKLALLKFKYWFDEPATYAKDGTEMTFWSENHQIQFATSEYLAGTLLSGESFTYDAIHPMTSDERRRRGATRVRAWLNHRLRFGFSEWNAPGYYNEDLPSLFTLSQFAPDPDVRTQATQVLDTVIFDLARLCCRGSFGITAGRAYWEHKAYGWEQSIGDTIEVLFGQRGDIVGSSEPSAVALATSNYAVPDVLLAIAIDRAVVDRATPQVDQVRVSMYPSEAAANQVDPSQEENLVFWWGNMNYFGPDTLDLTDAASGAHDNLKKTNPFSILYRFHLKDSEEYQVLYDTLETGAGITLAAAPAGAAALAAALPPPLDIIAVLAEPAAFVAGIEGAMMAVEGIIHLLGDIAGYIGKGLHAIAHWLGLADDDPPKIPDSAIIAAFHKILFAFNAGNVLQRANLYAYSNGDVALSSLQMHLPGQMAFQKHPWQATLGPDACVWTTAPFRSPSGGSMARGWLDFFADFLTFQTIQSNVDLALTTVDAGSLFGHDGFTYWNGSMALPMVVQYRSATLVAYQFNDLEKRLSDPATHAWFPKAMFDRVDDLVDANDGSWAFAEKISYDPKSGERVGSGYVALFSARKLSWTTDGPWKDKELKADGSSNIFVCFVGNEVKFGSLDEFKRQTLAAYLHTSGVGGLKGLQCSFDIPGESAPAGNSPRLELFYDDAVGKFAGQALDLSAYPRWQNSYATVPWGARHYQINHPGTGLVLTHDLDGLVRTYSAQPKSDDNSPSARRLAGGSLTPVRRFRSAQDIRRRPVGATLRDSLFHPTTHP